MTANADPGFSLIEALLASLVLSVGILALVQLFIMTARASAAAGDITAASLLAAEKVEELRALPWGTAAGGADRVGAYTRRWSVATAAPGAGDVVGIVVTIEPGGVRLMSSRARTVP